MNDFITYLNSTNNIDGNQTGTLAEAQITSAFYKKLQVKRRLGEFITEKIKNNQHYTFILTGHAGDGKTSILIQVLSDLGLLEEGEKLSEQAEYSNLYYVKDMSELPVEKQKAYFTKALSAPSDNKSSILISNTGPLLKAFEEFEKVQKGITDDEYTEADRIVLQSKILKQLDNNSTSTVPVCNHDVFLINVARLDNVSFSKKILRNIHSEELWLKCLECPCAAHCPIFHNHVYVSEHLEQVAVFVENYYRYLYESDKRMTIRQMMGQISYAITGNLTCEYIYENYKRLSNPLFYYNFANLFFGYKGIYPDRDTHQITGISFIQNLGLDKIAIDVDFYLFVSEKYQEYFDDSIISILEPLREKTRSYYRNSTEDNYNDDNKEKLLIRQSFRRFYYFFGTVKNQNDLYNQLFGNLFSDYCKIINSSAPRAKLNEIRDLIFKALYIKNTGFEPVNDDRLYLTLRREDDVFQNVMLVLGQATKRDLKLVQTSVNSDYEDDQSKYSLRLRIGNNDYQI